MITGAGAGYGAGIARRFAARRCARGLRRHRRSTRRAPCAARSAALAVQCDMRRRRIGEGDGARPPARSTSSSTMRRSRKSRRASRRSRRADLDRLLVGQHQEPLSHGRARAARIRAAAGGVVINIASVGALRPRPGMTWYNATKAAMHQPDAIDGGGARARQDSRQRDRAGGRPHGDARSYVRRSERT